MDARKNVVIIGGGIAGVDILKKLVQKKELRVTLIDPKEAFFYPVGAPRSLVDAEFAQRSFVPFRAMYAPGQVNHIQRFVSSIDFKAKLVRLAGVDDTVHYDILVIATGKSYAMPYRMGLPSLDEAERVSPVVKTTSQLLDELAVQRKALTTANEVVVVGGGATGVETASEIKAAFPNKTVKLVHSKSRLLDRQKEVSEKASSAALSALRAMGVEVALDTLYNLADTPAGTFVLNAARGRPNTSFLPSHVLDEQGFVKVDSHLRVIGDPNASDVFVIGDVVAGFDPNIKTVKMHVPVALANVEAVAQGKKLSHVKELPGIFASFFIATLGPQNPPVTSGIFGAMMGSSKRKDFLLHANTHGLIEKKAQK